MTTYIFSGQFNGCSILYPDFKSSKRFSKGTPGYGDPPDNTKPNLLINEKWENLNTSLWITLVELDGRGGGGGVCWNIKTMDFIMCTQAIL